MRRRRSLLASAAAVLVAIGVMIVVERSSGDPPRPPGPVQYATDALDLLELQGYYVDPTTWPAQRAEAEQSVRSAPDTYPALRKALATAGGKHSKFLPAGESLSDLDPTPPPPPSVTSTPDGVSTVTVPELVTEDPNALQQYADTIASGLHRAAPATWCGWIVDLRGNEGGNMWPMIAGLSPLLPDGTLLSFAARTGERTDMRM